MSRWKPIWATTACAGLFPQNHLGSRSSFRPRTRSICCALRFSRSSTRRSTGTSTSLSSTIAANSRRRSSTSRRLRVYRNVLVVDYGEPYSFAALNNWAAKQTDAPVLAFLNNDVEVITPEWLTEMVSHALRPEVGAVGAKLFYPNETIQHAGVVVGIGGLAGHPHVGLPRDTLGYFGRAACIQQFSAVTAACMVMRREVFLEMGGFDEKNFAIAFNDVDIGLRLRQAGYSIVWSPYAQLFHHESASLGLPSGEGRREPVPCGIKQLQAHLGECHCPRSVLQPEPDQYGRRFYPCDSASRGEALDGCFLTPCRPVVGARAISFASRSGQRPPASPSMAIFPRSSEIGALQSCCTSVSACVTELRHAIAAGPSSSLRSSTTVSN